MAILYTTISNNMIECIEYNISDEQGRRRITPAEDGELRWPGTGGGAAGAAPAGLHPATAAGGAMGAQQGRAAGAWAASSAGALEISTIVIWS